MPIILAGRPAITLSRIPGIRNEPISRARSEELLHRATAGKHDIEALRKALVDFARSELLASVFHDDKWTDDAKTRSEPIGDADATDADATAPGIAHQRIPIMLPGKSACHAHASCVADYVGFPLPPSSILRPDARIGLPRDTYLASPTLAFQLLARRLHAAATLVCALEFCGTYDVASAFLPSKGEAEPSGPSFLTDLSPAMTPQSLRSFIGHLPAGTRGIGKMRHAARLAVSGSASPMESRLFALLSISTKRGGYGFDKLQLNMPIELEPEEARLLGSSSIRVDVFMKRADGGGTGDTSARSHQLCQGMNF